MPSSVSYIDNYGVIIGAIARGKPKGTARVMIRLAETTARLSARKTGSASASWYARGKEVDNYASALSAAKGLNSKAMEVSAVDPPDDDSHIVSHAVVHPFFLEFGTVKMAAQPALMPAIEIIKNEAQDLFKSAIEIELGNVK